MSNVISIKKEKGEIEYIFDGDEIAGVSHSLWDFRIMRKGKDRFLECKKTRGRFGHLPADAFNSTLIAWLLIDEPGMADKLADDKGDL